MEHENELVAVRRRKLDELTASGVDAFGGAYPADGTIESVAGAYLEGGEVRAAGRITAHRNMGKSQFLDLFDFTGRIQIYLNAKDFPAEQWSVFEKVDIGDFLGVTGTYFTTRAGERSIRVQAFQLLTKSLLPLPDKWHGIQDVELKYRNRHLDLIANPHSREVFRKRIAIVRGIRRFLEDRGFIEAETPMMQAVAGGAAAEPFKTHHNALGVDLFLRIAPELYLKRLLVGGFPKVFELNRNFRNEGMSRRHNPEFTMLEAYWAFADFRQMADLVEELICHLAETICGTLEIAHLDAEGNTVRVIDLRRPWKRAAYHDLVEEAVPGWHALTPEARRLRAAELGLDIRHCDADHEVTQHAFEKLVEEKTINPCFVTHCPQQLLPLAKQNPDNPAVVDVFELVMNGQEVSPGYSELNDPLTQRRRLEEQSGGEQHKLDEEFLSALSHGMPPAGGIGIGIDRLVMMLTGAESIRDVILFPHMRPRTSEDTP